MGFDIRARNKGLAARIENSMNLTENPEIVMWPETHYVFIEKVGPFDKNAPQAWQEVQPLITRISEYNKIVGFISLYKRAAKIYRAGFSLATLPKNLPQGLIYEKFEGGKYSKFVLTGPYSDLPAASERVFEIAEEKKIQMRDDFCIENYVTDPKVTEEKKLITDILLPIASDGVDRLRWILADYVQGVRTVGRMVKWPTFRVTSVSE